MDTPRTDAVWQAGEAKPWLGSFMDMHAHAEKLEVESDSRLAVIRRAYELLSRGHRDEAELLLFTNRD
jgi:hypothetical protein